MNLLETPSSSSRSSIPPLGEVLDFMRLIWALDHALQKTSRRMGATLGVTGPQRLVIRIIGRFPGILASQLATILHVHPSTLTGILQRLERQGFVTRRPDPRDRRRALLGLTAKGRGVDAEAGGTVEAAVQMALSELSETQVRNTVEVLRRLTQLLRISNRLEGFDG